MYCRSVLVLIAVTAASPLGNHLLPRASTVSNCKHMSTRTTTVAEHRATLTGPFLLTASGSWEQSGFYAHHGYPSIYDEIIFDVSPIRKDLNATKFYLNHNKHLVSLQDGQMYFAWDQSGGVDDGNKDDENVIMTTDRGTPNKLTCRIDGESCAMDCNMNGNNFSCAATPGFQPDWRLSAAKKGAGVGCEKMSIAAHPV